MYNANDINATGKSLLVSGENRTLVQRRQILSTTKTDT